MSFFFWRFHLWQTFKSFFIIPPPFFLAAIILLNINYRCVYCKIYPVGVGVVCWAPDVRDSGFTRWTFLALNSYCDDGGDASVKTWGRAEDGGGADACASIAHNLPTIYKFCQEKNENNAQEINSRSNSNYSMRSPFPRINSSLPSRKLMMKSLFLMGVMLIIPPYYHPMSAENRGIWEDTEWLFWTIGRNCDVLPIDMLLSWNIK